MLCLLSISYLSGSPLVLPLAFMTSLLDIVYYFKIHLLYWFPPPTHCTCHFLYLRFAKSSRCSPVHFFRWLIFLALIYILWQYHQNVICVWFPISYKSSSIFKVSTHGLYLFLWMYLDLNSKIQRGICLTKLNTFLSLQGEHNSGLGKYSFTSPL